MYSFKLFSGRGGGGGGGVRDFVVRPLPALLNYVQSRKACAFVGTKFKKFKKLYGQEYF